jgi:hypothetical protein
VGRSLGLRPIFFVRMIDPENQKPIWRKRPLPIAIVILVLILVCGFVLRIQLLRAVTAYEIARAHVLIAPPRASANESAFRYHIENAEFYWDFAGFRIARELRLKQLNPTLKPLVAEITRRQAAGEQMQYSMHIYREIRWRLNFTPDVAATRARIEDLRQSLSDPSIQKLGTEQDPADGSWGRPINVWYLKLYYSVDEVTDSISDHPPQYPLRFLDPINSPDLLATHLDAVLHNDITRTGVFNREELDETFSALARLLFAREQKLAYAFDPKLQDALRQFVLTWQNPASGCWGQWLVDRHGRVWKMDDVAMTFHVVADLRGDVPHLDRIAGRILDLDNVNFPAGIRFDGHYENHLNWDVVKILKAAWPSLDEATRARGAAEINRMLDWCLKNSLQPDGSFKVSELDDTLGDAFYYGVSFLTDAGYFDKSKRFWTNKDFPDSEATRAKIQSRIQSIGLSDPNIAEAYRLLQPAAPPVPTTK